MGKDKSIESIGKIDIRMVFDEKPSDYLRQAARHECRTLAAQIRFIVKQWCEIQPQPKEPIHAETIE